jgi:Membrane bound O-acyl transferase family
MPAPLARPTLRQYCEQVLGTTPAMQLRNLFVTPWLAGSFAGFWRAWNPVWTYPLRFIVLPRLRRVVPLPMAIVLTFAVSGAVHDALLWAMARRTMFPVMTIFLGICGVVSVATARAPRATDRSRGITRAGRNAAQFVLAGVATWGLSRALG